MSVAEPTYYVPDDEYEGLSSTFAAACREADRKFREQQAARLPRRRSDDDLPESTKQALTYLLQENDSERLQKLLECRSEATRTVMLKYIERKRSR